MISKPSFKTLEKHLEHPSDPFFMRMALEQAHQAFALGEVPVGAVIVQQEKVIVTAFNRREVDQDPTAHAEMIAIREASSKFGSWRLNNTTIYVTLEPCAMCAGALIQSRVARLVFGAFDPKGGACGSLCNLLIDLPFNHQVLVNSGVLADECGAVLQDFFHHLRQASTVNSN